MILNLPAGLSGSPQTINFTNPSQNADESSLRQAIASGGLREDTPLPGTGLPVTVGGDVLGLSISRPQPAQSSPALQGAPTPQPTPIKPNSLGSKPVNIANTINQMASKFGISPRLIYATVMNESSGHPYAYRAEPQLGTASYGLGQPLYTTAKSLGYTGTPEGLYDPTTNLDITAHYLAKAIQSGAKTPQQVAAFYNSGSVNGNPVPGYVNRFMKNYQAYQPGMDVDINE